MPADSTGDDAGLALLTGPEVHDLLAATLARAGGRVTTWSLRDVDHRPAGRTTASYTAHVVWPDGEREETLGASVVAHRTTDAPAAAAPEADGRLIVTDGEHQVEMWRFPFDPELPGLAAATFPGTASAMLRGLGLDDTDLSLRVLAYRPRKRAVVEVHTRATRMFLKIMRPRIVADVDRRHRLLAAAGLPVARVLARSDDGLLVLEALSGTPLRDAIRADGAAACHPAGLTALLDRLPDEVARLPRRTPWAGHVVHYAGVVAAALPDEAARLHRFAAGVDAELARYDDGDEPTHGDFYEAQLLVDGGAVSGLLDIDTLGPGRRADDLACLLAHLSVLTVMDGDSAGVQEALTSWQAEFERQVSAHELRVRTAAVVLSLATGPFRAQEAGWAEQTLRRIALAERWLEAAGQGENRS